MLCVSDGFMASVYICRSVLVDGKLHFDAATSTKGFISGCRLSYVAEI